MSRKPENATAGEETAAESRVRVQAAIGEDGIQKIKEGFPYFNILSKERGESTTPDWHAEFFY